MQFSNSAGKTMITNKASIKPPKYLRVIPNTKILNGSIIIKKLLIMVQKTKILPHMPPAIQEGKKNSCSFFIQYRIHESQVLINRNPPRNVSMTHFRLLHFIDLFLNSQFQILHSCRVHHRHI